MFNSFRETHCPNTLPQHRYKINENPKEIVTGTTAVKCPLGVDIQKFSLNTCSFDPKS